MCSTGLTSVTYEGILDVSGDPHGTVEHRKCIQTGGAECEFHIKG